MRGNEDRVSSERNRQQLHQRVHTLRREAKGPLPPSLTSPTIRPFYNIPPSSLSQTRYGFACSTVLARDLLRCPPIDPCA
ncbi:hypothetical protein BD309DRAFT_867905 [Dichomitus squalens]|uniref:Uncharacterized protein n=2 Tax=Dichomitus squalens TaxID=114155 RepID=A0A4Q9MD25_9APHY|nr:uncharacterized protein DICSQDRAFT_156698 [Dichomitus squalens LYAD-421 SS1]EJF58648.1 hypothetical protein DICSQDRAFT_156698 [Dichomitus squalens LYAD-421 SS1]TBU24467.1 hypothetical protein BD311DRAFT_729594 [Dichomitus squalens]TBU41632.1 hypothetical protein BD309DRAFT_867905 [Dichomitus squalens]TBU55436.1 hypothetical protein BD310DRAFT_825749 [Dichomitus squalens]